MTDRKALERLVDKTVREHFTNAEIISVNVREDLDHDGDEIIWITVLYSSKEKNRLGTDLRTSFLSHLRPKLEEINIHAFPVMDYIPQMDGDEVPV